MRIGIDCRLSGLAHAGIGRYLENLILRLPNTKNLQWVLFFNSRTQQPLSLKNLTNIEVIITPIKHYSLLEQTRLYQVFNQTNLDLLHVPHFNVPIFYKKTLAITIHDLLWHEHKGLGSTTLPWWQYYLKYLAYKITTHHAITKASLIFVPSHTVKKTLLQLYPNFAEKIYVTQEGVDDRLLKFKNSKLKRQKHQLIYVGSLYPHKNVKLILNALTQLKNWQLNIVSSRNIFQTRTKELVRERNLDKQVKFFSNLPDESLAKVIQTAQALIQPSFSEGFGLTGLEAMSLSTPVLASQIAVFKEVYQNAVIYFNPTNTLSLINAIKQLEKQKPSSLSMQKVVKQYSWDVMAKQTFSLMIKQISHKASR